MTSASVPLWPPCSPMITIETQVAADGQEALERLTAVNADVIVSDLVMPRMDGFELLRQLKEHGDLTPAIVLTGFGSMEKALTAVHDLKAFWYLEKPVDRRAFKILLELAIRHTRSRKKRFTLSLTKRHATRASKSRPPVMATLGHALPRLPPV